MRSITIAAIAALIAAGCAQAQAADPKAKPILKAPPPPPAAGSFWIGAEYLNWSTKGDHLPPLVTTSPAGTPQAQAGVLGAPGTSVLFGDGNVNDRWRSGLRVRGGYWFDPRHSEGLEAQFFFLGRNSTGFSAASAGTPILAEPFRNAVTGLQDANLIAFPGLVSGSVAVSDRSRLFGGGADYRRELCSGCAFGSVSALAGYRYLRLQENLAIDTTSAGLGNFLGLSVTTAEQFATANTFHGLDLGLTGDLANGPWRLTWLAKLAVGGTFTHVDISGANTVSFLGATVSTPGGIYTQPSNIGTFNSSRFAVAPELGVNAGYQLTNNLRAFAGYNLIYWTGLVRPGGAIDTTINTTQVGGGALVGTARPLAQSSTTDYWAQGVNVGLVYNY